MFERLGIAFGLIGNCLGLVLGILAVIAWVNNPDITGGFLFAIPAFLAWAAGRLFRFVLAGS